MTSITPPLTRRCFFPVILVATTLTAAHAIELPSSFNSLSAAFESLKVGTTLLVTIQLMGQPKTQSEKTTLGLKVTELTWVDITLTQYSATFVSDHLIQKSAVSH